MPEEQVFDEGYQEYTEAEDIPVEQPEEELEEPEPQEGGEPSEEEQEELLEVEYVDENGEVVKEQMTYDQFNEAMRFYKTRGATSGDDISSQVAPYLERYKNSKTLQYVDFLLSQGLDDTKILSLMYKDLKEKGYDKTLQDYQEKPEQPQEEPYFDSVDEGIKYYVNKIKDELVKEIEPIKNELMNIKNTNYTKEVLTNNEYMLTNSLKKHGWDPNKLTQEQVKKIGETFLALHPGNNLAYFKLNQPQANAIIKEALGYRDNKYQKNAAKAAKIQSKAPKVMPGTPTKGIKNPVELPSIITGKQAKENLNKLFS